MARDSVYGRLLNAAKVPSWVFGGEYGDISNTLNARDLGFERVQAAELENDRNQMSADQEQKQLDFGDRLGDIFSNDNSPKSLGDMYKAQIGAALETGNPIMAAKLQEELLQYDENERRKKAQEFSNAAQFADTLSPDVLTSRWPDFPRAEAERIFNEKRAKKTGGGKEKTYDMVNPKKSGAEQYLPDVPASQIKGKMKDGWITVDQLKAQDYIETAKEMLAEKPQAQPGGLLSPLIPYAQKGDRYPGQTAPKGDTARLSQPSVNDEVRDIKRKRSPGQGSTMRG